MQGHLYSPEVPGGQHLTAFSNLEVCKEEEEKKKEEKKKAESRKEKEERRRRGEERSQVSPRNEKGL